jgi:hypothetical protein
MPEDDIDTWWMMVEVYIHDHSEKFPKADKTIDWIRSVIH